MEKIVRTRPIQFDLDQGVNLEAKAASVCIQITDGRMPVLYANGVNDLLARCDMACGGRADLSAVWIQIVRTHPLVLELPIQVIVGSQPQLKVQPINGPFLCFSESTYNLAGRDRSVR